MDTGEVLKSRTRPSFNECYVEWVGLPDVRTAWKSGEGLGNRAIGRH